MVPWGTDSSSRGGIVHISLRFYLAFTLGVLVTAVASAKLQIPDIPPGHPRVYLRLADVADIRAKILLPEFQDRWSSLLYYSQTDAAAAAFVYLIEQDQSAGHRAIDRALEAVRESTDARTFDAPMHWCACVYDWCYDILAEAEKNDFVAQFERIAALYAPGYPADINGQAIVGHTTEGWLLTGQLPAGVAIYDETPIMYDAAARLFFNSFVPVRNLYYPSHAHHQGDSYFGRFAYDIAAAWLFRNMGAGDVFSYHQQFVPYHVIYNNRPDGRQIRRGDTYDDSGRYGKKRLIAMMTGAYYEAPYVLTMADDSPASLKPFHQVLQMIFRQPALEKRPIVELPLTKYFADPMGEMVARTGWAVGAQSPDAIVYMRLGGIFFGNHQRRDMGTFQIYYRGPLAIASGVYQGVNSEYGSDHWKDYYHQTLAHNGLLIFDPGEVPVKDYFRSVNDGGQRIPNKGYYPRPDNLRTKYRLGNTTSRQFGPDAIQPEYSYISGDITDAYTDKVQLVTCSMVTLNLQNSRYPCSLIVFDRVVSSNPQFKKTWLLHSIQEPEVSGRTITVVRDEGDYGGKLVTQSLFPASASVTKVGGPGKEFWVESVQHNYATSKEPPAEPGAWRIEVSPSTNRARDIFLHVMTVMDDSEPYVPSLASIETSDGSLVGAVVLDRAVVFGREETLLESASFKVPGSGAVKILVCDLQPGSWSVSLNDHILESNLLATDQGKCVYFEAEAGLENEYSLELNEALVIEDNDDCSDAIGLIDGVPYEGSSVGAVASGLTSCAGASDTVDVWHYYKPAEDSEVTISLCGSAFDTTLAVYDSCGKTMLQCNDDSDACGAYSMQSSLTMALKADRTYYIRVAGYDGATGDYIITVFGGRGTVGIAADFDNSGDVDLYDLAFIFEQWLAEGPARHPDTGKSPDLRYDGTINFGDFSIFALSRLEQ